MSKFFYDLTKSNWGFPWHIIEADILGCIGFYVLFQFGIEMVFMWHMMVVFFFVNVIGYGYEVYQAKKDPSAKEEFWEDMTANNVGFLLASGKAYLLFWISLRLVG